MIYFVTGEERKKVQDTEHNLIAALQKKRPGALLFRITPEDWNKDSFDGIATGQGLFENKYIVVLDSLFTNEEAEEHLKDKMKELKEADHAFIFVEYAPLAAPKKLIEKFAEKVWETKEEKKEAKSEFNIFSLTDALGDRDRNRLWALYQKALFNGSEPEEIHGILFWQVKSLLAAAQSKSPADSGLKPFVWSKSQRFMRNYSLDELKNISSRMVSLYHISRIESRSLEDSLEEFVLSV